MLSWVVAVKKLLPTVVNTKPYPNMQHASCQAPRYGMSARMVHNLWAIC